MTQRQKFQIALIAAALLGWWLAITSIHALHSARQDLDCATNYTLAQLANGQAPDYCKEDK